MDNKGVSGDEISSLIGNSDSEDEQTLELKFSIFIKLLNGSKHTVKVSNKTKISELKEKISNLVNIPSSDQRLVLSGRILENIKTIQDYNIKENQIIFVTSNVISSTSNSSNHSRTLLSDETQFNFGNLNRDLNIPDPLINSMLQGIMDRPDLLRMIFDSNPAISELRERNPELNHILDDPQLLRQSMEMMQNPALMREMTRTADRAMNNIEAVPGGFNALRRMYQNFQEPLWNATMERRTNNSESGNSTNPPSQEYNLRTDQPPISEALPNPWVSGNTNRNSISQLRNQFFPNFSVATDNNSPIVDLTNANNITQTSTLTNNSNKNSQESPTFHHRVQLPFDNSNNLNLSSNNSSSSTENSEIRFRSQLVALRDMGFTDTQRCIQALEQSGGNINRAIDRLLSE